MASRERRVGRSRPPTVGVAARRDWDERCDIVALDQQISDHEFDLFPLAPNTVTFT
jgi:hypothetical protein